MKSRNRKKWILGIGLVVVMIGITYIMGMPYSIRQETAWSVYEGTLETGETIVDGVRDGAMAYLVISREGNSDYGDLFAVVQMVNNKWTRCYDNDFKGLKPWKIEVADIDGEGSKEILIAVKKTTHFDKDEKNRIFLFHFDGEKLIKKWTGSETVGDWRDFTVGDVLSIPGDELVFIEKTKNEEEHICLYYWFDFGFFLMATSKNYKDIQSLSIVDDNYIEITYGEDKKHGLLTVRDGEIVDRK